MSFTIRILFSGLMTFVPAQNGTEMDVVLLNAGCTRQVSDGGAMPLPTIGRTILTATRKH